MGKHFSVSAARRHVRKRGFITMIKPGDGAQGGWQGTPALEATCLECRVNSNRRLATVFQSWTWRTGFLPKEARGLGNQAALKVGRSRLRRRCTSPRAPSGRGGGCLGASVRAGVGAAGTAWPGNAQPSRAKGRARQRARTAWDAVATRPNRNSTWPDEGSVESGEEREEEGDIEREKKIRMCGRITARADRKEAVTLPESHTFST